jgi:two-component system LytT family response regulator
MIRTLIIDDEAFARELLKQQLQEYCSGLVEVIGLAGSAIEGLKLINQLQPQLVFLDVEMPRGSGFDLLELAGERNFEVIFTTAYQEYALKALKSEARDYLLKPIDADELAAAVKKVQLYLDGKQVSGFTQRRKIKLHGLRETLLVSVSDVLYLEADGRYSTVYLAGGRKHIVSRNIGEFEEELVPHHFFRIHKSLLVNLEKVKQLHHDHENIELEEGTILPVSKRRQSSVAALLKGKPAG